MTNKIFKKEKSSKYISWIKWSVIIGLVCIGLFGGLHKSGKLNKLQPVSESNTQASNSDDSSKSVQSKLPLQLPVTEQAQHRGDQLLKEPMGFEPIDQKAMAYMNQLMSDPTIRFF